MIFRHFVYVFVHGFLWQLSDPIWSSNDGILMKKGQKKIRGVLQSMNPVVVDRGSSHALVFTVTNQLAKIDFYFCEIDFYTWKGQLIDAISGQPLKQL